MGSDVHRDAVAIFGEPAFERIDLGHGSLAKKTKYCCDHAGGWRTPSLNRSPCK